MGKYRDYLARNGLKSTIQRDLIVEEFIRSKGHKSAEELYSSLRAEHSSIGLATVYRTLKILTLAGLAKERRFNDGFIRYELAGPERSHHDHLVCVSCGKVVEFENDAIEDLQRKVAASKGFRMLDHKLEIYGYCEACQSKD
jgi:Fur family ferric uptake transcriptional regulator